MGPDRVDPVRRPVPPPARRCGRCRPTSARRVRHQVDELSQRKTRRGPAATAQQRGPGPLDPQPRHASWPSGAKEHGEDAIVISGELLLTTRTWADPVARAYVTRRGLAPCTAWAAPTSRAGSSGWSPPGPRPPSYLEDTVAELRSRGFAASLTHITPLAPVIKALERGRRARRSRRSPSTSRSSTGDGTGARVAIIDTGIDAADPRRRLADRDRPPSDGRPAPPTATTSTSTRSTTTRPTAPRPVRRATAPSSAGIVAQVAPGADISVYRALSAGGTGTEIEVACAMIRAVSDGAQIVNLSLGTQTQYDQPSLAHRGRPRRRRARSRCERGRRRADRRRGGQLRRHRPDVAGGVPPGRLRRLADGRPAAERVLEPRLVGRLRDGRRGHPLDLRRRARSRRTSRANPRRSGRTRSPGGAGRRSRRRRSPAPSPGSCTSGASTPRPAYIALLATGTPAARLRPGVRDPAGSVSAGHRPRRAP